MMLLLIAMELRQAVVFAVYRGYPSAPAVARRSNLSIFQRTPYFGGLEYLDRSQKANRTRRELSRLPCTNA